MHPRPETVLALLLLPTLLVSAARAQCPVAEFAGGPLDTLGAALSISGDALAAGVPGDGDAGVGAGAIQVFRRTSYGGWIEEAKLVPADATTGDKVGTSLAIDGDRLVAGAPDAEDGLAETSVGAAYVFERGASGWVEVAKLTASDGAGSDFFGLAVALSGDVALVGAPGDDPGVPDGGSAYVFRRDPTGAWNEVAKLVASDPGAKDYLGFSLAFAGEAALVGAPHHTELSGNGAVYAFEPAPSGWQQTSKLVAGDGAVGDQFGFSIGVDGATAVIGAPGTNALGIDSGAIYVYRNAAPGTWSEVTKLVASDGAASEMFGYDVAIAGAALVAGRPFGGATVVFEQVGAAWVRTATLAYPGTDPSNGFGRAVVIAGPTVVVGAPADDSPFFATGSVHFFELPPDLPLVGCPPAISLADGGSHVLQLNAGAAHAGALYLVLGSASGTAPGIPYDGSLLPLNLDAYLMLTLTSPNTPPLGSSLGFLGAAGEALTTFHLPAVSSPALAGLTVHHAAVALPFPALLPIAFVSNAAAVTLAP